MADGPSPAKKLKTDDTTTLPECPYGARCYRKNPQHFKEFSHSSGSSADGNTSASDSVASATSDSVASATTKSVPIDDSNLPPCKYGTKCYRKNLLHFAEYSHPTSHPSKGSDGSGSDTDVYDSDDGKEKNEADKKGILSKGMSLVKKYSQMTNEERKELIKQAFEEKLRLQEELEGAKKMMESKDKELQHLKSQVNNGLLLIEGEEEAMKKTTTTYFPLMPERAYKEGSASQIHFRLAESQFYRLLSAGYQSRVTKVEYVVSPNLVKKFREYQSNLRKLRGPDISDAVLGFHGTDEKNIKPICETGFKVPGESGFHHKTDTGYYGAGVYFSEYPTYSMAYIQGGSKLMLCEVLPGKVYKCSKLIHGAKLMKGFDSHMSPCKNELIIFHSAAILPRYIIYFSNTNTNFTYQNFTVPDGVQEEYKTAAAAAPTKAFNKMKITLLGKLAASHAEIYKLIAKHGGSKGTKSNFHVLVASSDNVGGFSKEVLHAIENLLPIVPETYLYQCIQNKKKLSPEDFEFDVDAF